MLFYAVFVFRHATLHMTGIREAARGVDILPRAATNHHIYISF
jgi:hypothetical protein